MGAARARRAAGAVAHPPRRRLPRRVGAGRRARRLGRAVGHRGPHPGARPHLPVVRGAGQRLDRRPRAPGPRHQPAGVDRPPSPGRAGRPPGRARRARVRRVPPRPRRHAGRRQGGPPRRPVAARPAPAGPPGRRGPVRRGQRRRHQRGRVAGQRRGRRAGDRAARWPSTASRRCWPGCAPASSSSSRAARRQPPAWIAEWYGAGDVARRRRRHAVPADGRRAGCSACWPSSTTSWREWAHDEATAIRSVAEALAVALARDHDRRALVASEEQFRLIAEHAGDVITLLDADGLLHLRLDVGPHRAGGRSRAAHRRPTCSTTSTPTTGPTPTSGWPSFVAGPGRRRRHHLPVAAAERATSCGSRTCAGPCATRDTGDADGHPGLGARRHRPQDPRGRADPPRPPRPADRRGQPHPVRPAPGGGPAGPAPDRHAVRRAGHRPRRVQGGQRRPRAPRGRPGPGGGGGPAGGQRAPGRHRGTGRRRRVHGAVPRRLGRRRPGAGRAADRGPQPARWRWPAAGPR